jgi:hypothetical protein
MKSAGTGSWSALMVACSHSATCSGSDPAGEPLSTSRATRLGWVTATRRAVKQLPEWPTRVARWRPMASRKATVSAAKSSIP